MVSSFSVFQNKLQMNFIIDLIKVAYGLLVLVGSKFLIVQLQISQFSSPICLSFFLYDNLGAHYHYSFAVLPIGTLEMESENVSVIDSVPGII